MNPYRSDCPVLFSQKVGDFECEIWKDPAKTTYSYSVLKKIYLGSSGHADSPEEAMQRIEAILKRDGLKRPLQQKSFDFGITEKPEHRMVMGSLANAKTELAFYGLSDIGQLDRLSLEEREAILSNAVCRVQIKDERA